MRNTEDWLKRFTFPLPIMWIIFSCNRKSHYYSYQREYVLKNLHRMQLKLIPSLILASRSRSVGSISSHPSGYFTRLVFILGMLSQIWGIQKWWEAYVALIINNKLGCYMLLLFHTETPPKQQCVRNWKKKIYMFPNIHSARIYTANSHKMFF